MKTTTKSNTGAAKAPRGTTLQILDAMLRTETGPEELANNLQAAARHLDEFLVNRHGFNDCAIRDTAESILADVTAADARYWPAVLAVAERVQLGDSTLAPEESQKLGTYIYLIAGASFALGMTAGMRLSGGAR